MKQNLFILLGVSLAGCNFEPEAMFGGGKDYQYNSGNNSISSYCKLQLTEVSDNLSDCTKPTLDTVYDIDDIETNSGREITWIFRKISNDEGFPIPRKSVFLRFYTDDNDNEAIDSREAKCELTSVGDPVLAKWQCHIERKNGQETIYKYFRIQTLELHNDKCGRIVRYEAKKMDPECLSSERHYLGHVYVGNIPVSEIQPVTPHSLTPIDPNRTDLLSSGFEFEEAP